MRSSLWALLTAHGVLATRTIGYVVEEGSPTTAVLCPSPSQTVAEASEPRIKYCNEDEDDERIPFTCRNDALIYGTLADGNFETTNSMTRDCADGCTTMTIIAERGVVWRMYDCIENIEMLGDAKTIYESVSGVFVRPGTSTTAERTTSRPASPPSTSAEDETSTDEDKTTTPTRPANPSSTAEPSQTSNTPSPEPSTKRTEEPTASTTASASASPTEIEGNEDEDANDEADEASGGQSKTVVIVGAVVGSVGGLALIAAAIFFVHRRKKKNVAIFSFSHPRPPSMTDSIWFRSSPPPSERRELPSAVEPKPILWPSENTSAVGGHPPANTPRNVYELDAVSTVRDSVEPPPRRSNPENFGWMPPGH